MYRSDNHKELVEAGLSGRNVYMPKFISFDNYSKIICECGNGTFQNITNSGYTIWGECTKCNQLVEIIDA